MVRTIVATVLAATLFTQRASADDVRRAVTGLDERNHSLVLFDGHMPLKAAAPGVVATNFWITDVYPPGLLKEDPAGRPIGIAPPDNGTTSVHLKQGDVIVQQATNHAWINRGTQPCRILFVLMDAKEP